MFKFNKTQRISLIHKQIGLTMQYTPNGNRPHPFRYCGIKLCALCRINSDGNEMPVQGVTKKSFIILKAYINVFRGHVQCFELP
jgi:hypothetical protein